MTEKGRNLIRQIDEVSKDQLTPALALLDDTELEALAKGLEALAEALRTFERRGYK